MIGKPLVHVEQADIEALKANKVVELATLEYKRDLPSTDDQRREIVYDIISLANTRGVLAVASNRGNLDRDDQADFERRDGFGLLIAA